MSDNWHARQDVIADAAVALAQHLNAAVIELQVLLGGETGLDPELAVIGESLNFALASSTRIMELLKLRWGAHRDAIEARKGV